MFSLNYFWFFLLSQFFCEPLRRFASSNEIGANPAFRYIAAIVAPLVMTANVVFLILGFWFMPHWYYPLIFIAIDLLLISVHALMSHDVAKFIIMLLGVVAAPLFCVLAYLGLFSVI